MNKITAIILAILTSTTILGIAVIATNTVYDIDEDQLQPNQIVTTTPQLIATVDKLDENFERYGWADLGPFQPYPLNPNTEQPTEESPTEEPTEESPTEEQPTEESPTEESPTEESPTDDKEPFKQENVSILDAAKIVWNKWKSNHLYYSQVDYRCFDGVHMTQCSQYVYTVAYVAGVFDGDITHTLDNSSTSYINNLNRSGKMHRVDGSATRADYNRYSEVLVPNVISYIRPGDILSYTYIYNGVPQGGHTEVCAGPIQQTGTEGNNTHWRYMAYSWGGADFGGNVDASGINPNFPEGSPPSKSWLSSEMTIAVLRK